jgi:GT2 family glycosyltransferase
LIASLSVVIPTHNRPDLLRACLASVRRYAPSGAEILVVDDASPAGVARRVAAEFASVGVLSSPRRGFCAAANAGTRAARAPVVQILNDDTEVQAGWAETALRWFCHPTVGAVAPLVLRWPGDEPGGARIDSAGDRYYLGGVAGKRGHGEIFGGAYLRPCRVFGASASSAFYRRDVLLRVGGFPEEFGAYFEDVDLAFRLHRAGRTVVFEPGARVLHRGSASYGRPGRLLLEQQSRNEERVFWRNIPTAALPRALPRHLAVLLGKALRRWQEGNLTPFVCGRLRLLGELPALVRHRRWLARLGAAGDLRDWEVASRYW